MRGPERLAGRSRPLPVMRVDARRRRHREFWRIQHGSFGGFFSGIAAIEAGTDGRNDPRPDRVPPIGKRRAQGGEMVSRPTGNRSTDSGDIVSSPWPARYFIKARQRSPLASRQALLEIEHAVMDVDFGLGQLVIGAFEAKHRRRFRPESASGRFHQRRRWSRDCNRSRREPPHRRHQPAGWYS